jgi:hypothetical protein
MKKIKENRVKKEEQEKNLSKKYTKIRNNIQNKLIENL